MVVVVLALCVVGARHKRFHQLAGGYEVVVVYMGGWGMLDEVVEEEHIARDALDRLYKRKILPEKLASLYGRDKIFVLP